MCTREFDLNIERVLEHWTVAHAVREVIANALDEQALTGTPEPQIYCDEEGNWHIRDFGRGLRHQHLTQKENREKLSNSHLVVGKFGVGLKDALATFHRRRIEVIIRSRYGDITVAKRQKHGFRDVKTLHAIITDPSDPDLQGTDFILKGVTQEDVEEAKNFFLLYSGEELIESTKYGQVLQKQADVGRIYVNGLHVASEENFLFSYNITSLTTSLRKALNRERTNVGRSAYSDRVKAILLECTSKDVAEALARDLEGFETGRLHDELSWTDVAVHACRILNANGKVIFMTPSQIGSAGALISYAKRDGYRIVIVPDSIARKLPMVRDVFGQSMMNLAAYQTQWNASFKFKFVRPEEMTPEERSVYELTWPILRIFPQRTAVVIDVMISETMRIDECTGQETVGVYDSSAKRIVIRRDQLQDKAKYVGTLLHELTHALTGTHDLSLEFEQALTDTLGALGVLVIRREDERGDPRNCQ